MIFFNKLIENNLLCIEKYAKMYAEKSFGWEGYDKSLRAHLFIPIY